MYGHQLLLPVPDIDRTSYFLVFGANPMASNGSLMTVPDFPGRLRELKARGGRMVVFDPRRTETAKVAAEHHFVRPGTDAYVLLAMLHVLFAEGLTSAAGVRRRAGRGRPARSPGSRPRPAEAASGVPGRRDPPARPRVRGRRRRRGVRPDRGVHPGVRHALPVGDPAPQPGDRQPRPRGRRHVHHPRRRRRRRRPDRPRATTAAGEPGARASRSSAASCRWRRWPRRSTTPGRGPDPGDADAVRQPGAVHARRGAARAGAATGWTSWSPSTSTSTRPPGTPT